MGKWNQSDNEKAIEMLTTVDDWALLVDDTVATIIGDFDMRSIDEITILVKNKGANALDFRVELYANYDGEIAQVDETLNILTTVVVDRIYVMKWSRLRIMVKPNAAGQHTTARAEINFTPSK